MLLVPSMEGLNAWVASVCIFDVRDRCLTDELVKRVRDQGPASVPDAKGFLGLFDRERGTALGITFFDSEEAIRNSQRAFEDMAQNFPAEMRGRRASVDVSEVMMFDGDIERAQAARVSSLKGSPDNIDDSVGKVQSETLPKVHALPGNVGAI